MSNSEKYLDELLMNSMNGNNQQTDDVQIDADVPEGTADEGMAEDVMDSDEDFLKAFEKDMFSDTDTDAFVHQFEQELEQEGAGARENTAPRDDAFFDNIDDILNNAQDDMDDIMVDTIGDETFATAEAAEEPEQASDFMAAEEPEQAGDFATAEETAGVTEPAMDFAAADVTGPEELQQDAAAPEETAEQFEVSSENQKDDEDTDVQMDDDLMSLLQSDAEFSDLDDVNSIDDLMPTDSEMNGGQTTGDDGDTGFDFGLDDVMGAPEMETEAQGASAEADTEDEKPKKPGFFKRFALALFGPDEDEQEEAKEPEKAVTALPPDIEDLSDENLALLQALEGGGAAEEPEAQEPVEDEKARKKREKQEKKEQKKKEKAEKKEQKKKEKANKPKKEKKPKKPKEPDNTPPLPKVPVILCFVLAGSMLALVLVGTNLFGYSNSISEAEKSYQAGDYVAAFDELSGMNIKEKDADTYEKYRILANASGEYTAYQTFLENGYYDLALDSLVRTIGRCDKYAEDAKTYECTGQLADIRSQAVSGLGTFGISEARAVELYAIDDRTEYSAELYNVLADAGLDNRLDGE